MNNEPSTTKKFINNLINNQINKNNILADHYTANTDSICCFENKNLMYISKVLLYESLK